VQAARIIHLGWGQPPNSGLAAALVVSERAVEKHVANIFTKLGLPPSESDNRRVLAVLRYLES
jgi:DNA-binding NarL/FixJ family response regulator